MRRTRSSGRAKGHRSIAPLPLSLTRANGEGQPRRRATLRTSSPMRLTHRRASAPAPSPTLRPTTRCAWFGGAGYAYEHNHSPWLSDYFSGTLTYNGY